MAVRRRQIGGFAVLALVLLRLAIGWHFFSEGLEKIERDPDSGRFHLSFSAAPFLAQAKGPLVDVFRSLAPTGHDWQTLLAVPRQIRPLTADEAKAADDTPPYQAWADRIVEDWQALVEQVTALPNLSAEQIEHAKAALASRQQELHDYLAGESAAIAEYQHELWRLAEWRAKPDAESVPFQQDRIVKKSAETTSTARPWLAQVGELEATFITDLRDILTPDQRAEPAMAAALDRAVLSPAESRLGWVNLGATVLTIGVGICLLLGLFTRLASIAGAIFLLSIIATQPPWLSTAEPTINQTVELAGFLVLAATGAGRWLGLDYFSWALFGKHEE